MNGEIRITSPEHERRANTRPSLALRASKPCYFESAVTSKIADISTVSTLRGNLSEALQRSRRAQEAWAQLPVHARLRPVRTLRHLLVDHVDQLCAAVTQDMGKPLSQARGDIDGVVAHRPFVTHMDPAAPQFLNVLRVADIPDLLGMLAPRPLAIASADEGFQKTAAIYKVAGAEKQLSIGK